VRGIDRPVTVVERALDVIAPVQDRRADCGEEISLKIATLRLCRQIGPEKSPSAIKGTLRKIEAHMRAVDTAAKELPLEYWSRLFPERRRQTMGEWRRDTPLRLHRFAVEAEIAGIVVPPGAPLSDAVRSHAVKFAHELLSEFSGPPTLYVDGPWPQLAALLCEAIGVPGGNMFHQCRSYHRRLTGKSRRKR
jgi:hypothetical protein